MISTSHRSSSDVSLTAGGEPLRWDLRLRDGAAVRVVCSTRADGDFHRTNVDLGELERRRRGLIDLPRTMPDEHHGTSAVRVEHPGQHDGATGDIAVTAAPGSVLGCWVGDCAPIVLVADDATIAIVHAALLGPCIGPCCYEFGADDLARVATGVHADPHAVTGATRSGSIALDVTAAVQAGCAHHWVTVETVAGCTGCRFDGFSHRVRSEPQRHVVAAWISLAAA
jgi:polyphenol oxidase